MALWLGNSPRDFPELGPDTHLSTNSARIVGYASRCRAVGNSVASRWHVHCKGYDRHRMNFLPAFRRIIAAAVFAVAGGVGAAESGAAAAKDSAKASATDTRKATLEQIKAKSDKMVAEHEALRKQLKDATDAQRKEIIAKLEEQKKNFEESINALHKALREDERKRRQNAAPRRP